MMKFLWSLFFLSLFSQCSFKKTDTRYYELRTYYCNTGRLDDLINRFKEHTIKLFEKHGMENIGYWVPTDNKQNALYYILAYPNKEARDTSWKAFEEDPEWQKVVQQSEANGKIVAHNTSVFMTAADISPAIKSSSNVTARSFELRTYHCFPGKRPNLLARFRNHTIKLFEKHNMQSIAYWTPVESDTTKQTLVYMLAYSGEEEGKKSWLDFRADSAWIKVKADSEKNGKIVDSVESVFLKPLNFSAIK